MPDLLTFPATGHHRPLTGTKLFCLVTDAHVVCEQLAQGCYLQVERLGVEPAVFCVANQRPDHYTTRPILFLACVRAEWSSIPESNKD